MARSQSVAVIGAGVGGLAAALILAARGVDVTMLERAPTAGGKLRTASVGDVRIDCGPTVLTMPEVLEEILEEAGETLSAHLTLHRAHTLARHSWSAGETLDLFADLRQSADAIGAFAGPAEARGFLAFSARARRIHDTLDRSFMRRPDPSMAALIARVPPRALLRISPFGTLWQALGRHFRDPRLRQLFGRYATYCGTSPFTAPATLMLVADVERRGVWLVEGGMHRIASMLASLACKHGARIRYDAEVSEILVTRGRCTGVRLANGERIAADAVLCNGDVAALSAGLFGIDATRTCKAGGPNLRSLSALTWAVDAETEGTAALLRHNVFFSTDYEAEFAELAAGRPARHPTVYVCAQDRDADANRVASGGRERLLLIVNAPPRGDTHPMTQAEIRQCETQTFTELSRCGLTIRHRPERSVLTTPTQFARAFPGTGGALYGQASNGWQASFRRPGARSRIPGLFLAGGSTHPGPGVPMAALSGRMAAAAILQGFASTRH